MDGKQAGAMARGILALLMLPVKLVFLILGLMNVAIGAAFGWILSTPVGSFLTRGRFNPLRIFRAGLSVSSFMDEKFKNSENPFLRGDLEEAARFRYPEKDYPELYVSIRSDMDAGLIVNSRLISGEHLAVLGENYCTDEKIDSAFNANRSIGFSMGIAVYVLCLFASFSAFSGMEITQYPASDNWTGAEAEPGIQWATVIGSMTLPVLLVLLNPLTHLAAFATGLMAWVNSSLRRIHSSVYRDAVKHRESTKASWVAYKYFNQDAKVARDQYIRSVGHNNGYLKSIGFDKSLKLGTATGLFRARGALEYRAPKAGQEIRLDREGLTTGVAIMGQTGSGKTSSILLPMFEQLVTEPKFGFFIMDSKSVLWKDCLEVTKNIAPARADDFVVVGTGKDDFGVDLLEGMTPNVVSDTIRSVFEQLGGGSGADDYWPNAAAYLILQSAKMARAYEFTDEGKQYSQKTGKRPYCLSFIYDLVRKEKLADDVAKAIIQGLKKPNWKSVCNGDEQGLLYSIRYMTSDEKGGDPEAIRPMSDGQKSGVIGSVTKLLGFLVAEPELRDRFVAGHRENVVDVDAALKSKILAVNISKDDKGTSALLVMTFLKQRLYTAATIRQAKWKAEGLGNPQVKAPCIFICDEFQNFVSSSKTAGLHDGNAFNTLRSTGLTGVLAFQNFSSIKRVLGDKVADDFLAQMITKIVLVNDDEDTNAFVRRKSGKTLRLQVHRKAEHENEWMRASEKGEFKPVSEVEPLRYTSKQKMGSAFYAPVPAIEDFGPLSQKPVFNPMQMIERAGEVVGKLDADRMAELEWNIIQSAEDHEATYMTSGNEVRDIVKEGDVENLERWEAWISYPCAGLIKTDFMVLDKSIH